MAPAGCPDRRPFRITQWVIRPGAGVRTASFQPQCGLMSCAHCRSVKMQDTAARVARLVPPDGRVYVGRASNEKANAVKKAFQRIADGDDDAGRLIVGLEGAAHLHVANVDCLIAAAGKRVDVARVVLALRSEALPATTAGRWIGAWGLGEDEPGKRLMLLTHDVQRETEMRICGTYGFDRSMFASGTEFAPDDPELWRLFGAIEWWRTEQLGKARTVIDGRMIEPIPPTDFVLRDERRKPLE